MAVKINITIRDDIKETVDQLMKRDSKTNFSEYVEMLICKGLAEDGSR